MIPIALTFQTGIWLFLFAVFIQSRTGSVYHPFFYYLIFHGIVFVIEPIIAYVFGFETAYYLMRFYPTDDNKLFVLTLTTISLFVFGFTCWFIQKGVPTFSRRSALGFTDVEWKSFYIVLILLGPLTLYSAYIGLGAFSNENEFLGSPFEMSRDLRTGVIGYTNTTGYFVDAQLFLIPLCVMFLWGMRFRLWAFVPLLIFLGYRSYIGWGRWSIILPVISVGLLFLFNLKKRWVPLYLLIAAIPVFLLFQQLGDNRDVFKQMIGGSNVETYSTDTGQSWIDRQDGIDYANFAFLTYVVDVVPDKSGTYTYFTQYLQLFTEPIPRILWPGKPYGPPISLVNLNDYGNFTGWTTSLIGDGWMSFGWLGVIITMALVGYATGEMHRWFWRGEATNFKILTYCLFVPLTLQWYRDGGISIAKFVFLTIGPILLWKLVLSILQHSTTARKSILSKSPSSLL